MRQCKSFTTFTGKVVRKLTAMKLWLSALLLMGSFVFFNAVMARHYQSEIGMGRRDQGTNPCPDDDVTEVFVVINSVGFVNDSGEAVSRRLELIWHAAEVQQNDQVALYSADPEQTPGITPLVIVSAADYPDHFYTTNFTAPRFNFSDEDPVPTCLGFWGAYIRETVILSTRCLSTQPNWMEQSAPDIGDFHLHEIMIPGAHDSGSYLYYEGKKSDDNLFQRYASAQEETLLSQFYLGVRYFDTRVAFYPHLENHKFWLAHGFVPFRPFKNVVDDLVEMLKRTREIVVFEVGGFTGAFDEHPEAYQQFLDLLVPSLERWMAPVPSGPDRHVKLSELWGSDRRLVLTWDSDPLGRADLWPRIPNTWHNDNTPEALLETLHRELANAPRDHVWAVAGEMTDHTEDVIFDRLESLRDMADVVNRNISSLVRHDWWDKTNIVMADFFVGTYNVDTAILVNWQRAHC